MVNPVKIIRTSEGTVEISLGSKMEALDKNSKDLSDLLSKIGALLTSSIQTSIQREERDGVRFPPRGNPKNKSKSMARLINQLNKGGGTEGVFDERPVLRNTGGLFQSISSLSTGDKFIIVGTTKPYAIKQKRGDPIEIELQESARSKLAKFANKHDVQDEVAAILNTGFYISKIKPRDFTKVQDSDIDNILEATKRHFGKL